MVIKLSRQTCQFAVIEETMSNQTTYVVMLSEKETYHL